MQWSSWHNHTGDGLRFSYCAANDLGPEVYRRALRGGPWDAFAITEHAFALALPDEEQPWPFQWHHKPERLWEHRAFREDKTARFLERMAKCCDGERIFSGLEVEVACDGSLSMESLLWPYLDVVIGSIHYLSCDGQDPYAEHLAQLDMLLRYPIDILGHPFREIAKFGPIPDEIIDETLKRAWDSCVAVEINAHIPYAGDAEVLRRAVKRGIPIAFGLDAHHREDLQLHTYFADVLRAANIDHGEMRLFRPVRKSPKPKVKTLVR